MERTRYTVEIPVAVKFCTGSETAEKDLTEIARCLLPLEIEKGTAIINIANAEITERRKVVTKAEAEKESKIWSEFLEFRNSETKKEIKK